MSGRASGGLFGGFLFGSIILLLLLRSWRASGEGAERRGRSCRGPDGACADCTTTFKNAHGTVFREVLYRSGSVVREASGDP